MRNFCNQKNIDNIDNTNIKEDHLGIKKLHLNKKCNLVFAQNSLRYYDENIEKKLTLNVSRKVMKNVNLKT